MKRVALFLPAVLIIWGIALPVRAAEEPGVAEELTAQAVIECENSKVLKDGNETTYTKIADGDAVLISTDEGIASLYIIFDRIYGEWTLSDGVTDVVCGKNGFLHEYVDVAELFGYLPMFLSLTFSGQDCSLSELHIFGDGEVPTWVQRWELPCEEADLVLFSTHIDDEQLFFAGILPYYAGECGLAVQVVYFTDPFTYHDRPHEQLNGLWTVGVRNYPVCGEYKDAYSESKEDAYAHQQAYGFTHEDMVRFQVEMLRRFRPHVVVGHDINGEYGHGQHMINSETLREALDLAADDSYDPDSALTYGIWDTPKAYIHLWKENPIIMDWDQPLNAFDGKTAFQVSQEGFLCHESQQWTWFHRWMFGRNEEITQASQIKSYSPCFYGLYRTNVGLDVIGGDMFENIPQSYAEIAAEEIRRQEEALAEAEEIRREEEALAEAEEIKRKEEAERAALAEAAGEENSADIETRTNSADEDSHMVIAAAAVGMVLILLLTVLNKRRRKQ